MSESEATISGLVESANQHAESSESDLVDSLAHALEQLNVSPGEEVWVDGFDILGEAYQRLRSNKERRSLGQFFTPLWIGKLLAEWAVADRPASVLDPACGSGALLFATSKLEAAADTELLGYDVDPKLLGFARRTGAIRGLSSLRVQELNFLLDEVPHKPTAIVCNPPYTRHQSLDPEEKRKIHAGFEERLDRSFSRQSSLHALFLVRALEIAEDSARIAFLTPSHWLDMNYGEAIKEYVLEIATVDAILKFPASERVFGDVDTTASITLLTKRAKPEKATTPIHDLPTHSELPNSLGEILDNDQSATQLELKTTASWQPGHTKQDGNRLGEFLTVHRGLATGFNSFFVLSDSEVQRLQLPEDVLKRCAPAPRHFDGVELTEEVHEAIGPDIPKWLLEIESASVPAGPVKDYLDFGDTSLGVRDRYLVSKREEAGRPWHTLERHSPAPILFSYFNRLHPRFVRNQLSAVALNHWMLIQPMDGVDADELFAALQHESVVTRLKRGSREYSNGLWKVEPREMLEIRLPSAISENLLGPRG